MQNNGIHMDQREKQMEAKMEEHMQTMKQIWMVVGKVVSSQAIEAKSKDPCEAKEAQVKELGAPPRVSESSHCNAACAAPPGETRSSIICSALPPGPSERGTLPSPGCHVARLRLREFPRRSGA